ncbi:amino acid racemase [Robiginitalea sp. M366]|uniref:aspartate/glutamate racemase family protein n=1 Tax=Robiginitalea aestuariiviva TaxID=3036903 RepID=UPI00240E9427|nr:amino acid racemase [Robiginitalea aestuariiviva]MDG1571555.1 amino acid racemase [Robiginitalea aestuariiviva]
MKTLGMIGGTSWHATEAYYRMINEGVSRHIGTQGNPELILHSINIEVMRSRDGDRIRAKYLEVARLLEQHGAQGILICANTPHMVYEHVQPRIGIPILHIADATGAAAQAQGLKTLGLLGNKPTMTGDFISGRLQREFGIRTLIPALEGQERSNHYVSKELTHGKFTPEARAFFTGEIQKLAAAGAQGIILGCTELPLLIRQEEVDVPVLATTDLHARMAVDFILEREPGTPPVL